MFRIGKIVLGLILLAGLCLLYGFFIEPKLLKTRDVKIESSKRDGEPLRIVFLSDVHIGGFHVPAKRVDTIVTRVNELDPDMVLITGDFVNGHDSRETHDAKFNTEISKGLSSLSKLQADHGVFATIGNHDVWYDARFIRDHLVSSGVSVLDNEAKNIGDDFCIVGLADHDTQREDISAFSKCHNKTIIAMMHSPDSFQYLRSDTSLALAGHTHGGQINIPFIGRRITATSAGRKYAYGLLDFNGIPTFVTAGIGTSILPARFRAAPEIVVIELYPTDERPDLWNL